MDSDRQREIIRLWNRMRRVEGPLAEEIRIQVLQAFAEEANAKQAYRYRAAGAGAGRHGPAPGVTAKSAGHPA
jgi:hypothetical protein